MWQVPIKYESNNEVQKELLTQKSSKLLGTSIGKVNKGETTLARVKYDTQTLARLSAEVEQGKLSTYDRLGLIRDMFALAESGHIKTTEALEFCLKYKNETEYIVWAEIASGIDKVNHLIQDEPFVDLYHKYAREIFTPLAKKMTWENKKGEDNSHTFLRNLALSHSAFYGDKDTVKEGQKIFKEGNIKADLRSVVYSIVARTGKKSDWLKFEKMYKDAKLDEERDRIGRALSLFKDKTLLARTLTYALSSNVRTQDAPFIIGQVWQNSFGRDLTWQFVKHNWEKIMKTYGEGGHFLGRILAPLGSHKKISDAKEIEKFFKKNNAPGATRTIEQSLERIYSNAAWLKSDKKDIEKWLKKNYTR